MTADLLMGCEINPLAFVGLDLVLSHEDYEITFEDVLRQMCPQSLTSELSSIVSRYTEINSAQSNLPVVPANKRILERLVWPLKHAKCCYMIGNCLGTIALCGTVAEMLSILLFEITPIKFEGVPIAVSEQAKLFGRSFEKLGQDRRVNVLSAMRIVDTEMVKEFEALRNVRNRYLHLFSNEHESIATDAVAAYGSATYLVSRVLIQDFEQGAVVMNPDLIGYLIKNDTWVSKA